MLLYDGNCRFCTSGVDRWRRRPDVEVVPVQSGAGEPYGFPSDQPMGAVHLIDTDGTIHRGAAAIFRMIDLCGDFGGGLLWKLYRGSGWFRALSDRGYALVAAQRSRISALCGSGRCSVGSA